MAHHEHDTAGHGEGRTIDERVRARLRDLRIERGFTQEEVAERAAMDVSTLSRLESGKRRLSLEHLANLAGALEVSTDDLLVSAPTPDPRIKATPTRHDGLTMWALTRRGPAGGVHAYKVRIDPERNTRPPELPVHEGNDWMYVLSGRMRLCLGEDDMVIEAGEAVEFSTLTPHWFGAVDGPVELIGLFGPHGERMHLHP